MKDLHYVCFSCPEKQTEDPSHSYPITDIIVITKHIIAEYRIIVNIIGLIFNVNRKT